MIWSMIVYIIYFIGVLIIVNSIYLIISKPIRLKDLTSYNFNNHVQNGMMGIVNLVLSILFVLFVYWDNGFPSF